MIGPVYAALRPARIGGRDLGPTHIGHWDEPPLDQAAPANAAIGVTFEIPLSP